MVRKALRVVYLALAWSLVIGIPVQVFLAGMAVFGERQVWRTHASLGVVLILISIVLLPLAPLARLPRRTTGLTGLLVFLMLAGMVLTWLETPWLRGLHPVNALALWWLSIRLARPSSEASRSGVETAPTISPESAAEGSGA